MFLIRLSDFPTPEEAVFFGEMKSRAVTYKRHRLFPDYFGISCFNIFFYITVLPTGSVMCRRCVGTNRRSCVVNHWPRRAFVWSLLSEKVSTRSSDIVVVDPATLRRPVVEETGVISGETHWQLVLRLPQC